MSTQYARVLMAELTTATREQLHLRWTFSGAVLRAFYNVIGSIPESFCICLLSYFVVLLIRTTRYFVEEVRIRVDDLVGTLLRNHFYAAEKREVSKSFIKFLQGSWIPRNDNWELLMIGSILEQICTLQMSTVGSFNHATLVDQVLRQH